MVIVVVAYFIFIVLYLIFSAAAIYHLWRFGYVGDLTKTAIVLYTLLSVVVIAISLMAVSTINWSTELISRIQIC